MSISVYSIAMGVAWFTVAAGVGTLLLRRRSRGGMWLVGLVFVLGAVRMLVPLDHDGVIILESRVWYPAVQDWCRAPLLGALTGGRLLLLLWLGGGVVSFGRLSRQIRELLRFRQQARPAAPELWALARDAAGEFGYDGPLRLAVGREAGSAYQSGYFSPFILLPGNVEDYPEAEVRNMLRHELCHYVSGDLWIKLGLLGARCVLWWNPVMGPLLTSVEHMLELRCDRRVCALLPEGQKDYLATLLHMIESQQGAKKAASLGYIGITADEAIRHRFQMILADSRPGISKRILAGIILIVALFIGSYVVIVQPATAAPSDTFGESDFPDSTAPYIIHTESGEYEFYMNGEYLATLYEEELSQEPFCNYTIYEGETTHD